MKPLVRSTTRFKWNLFSHLRRKETLSIFSIWILCSSCSFNNSFQEGCLGQIKITVPPSKASAKAKKSLPLYKRFGISIHKNLTASSTHLVAASDDKDTSGDKAPTQQGHTRLVRAAWNVWKVTHHRAQQEEKSEARHAPERWLRAQYDDLLPGVFQRLFWRQGAQPFAVAYPSDQITQMLGNTETESSWRERPSAIRLCYHSKHTNRGWGKYHMPLPTARVSEYCESGHALGSGDHWYTVNNTYAASAMPCRVFFSPGRAHLVAQCGSTLYKAQIRAHAGCLLTGEGERCTYPHAILKKLNRGTRQAVEWRQ